MKRDAPATTGKHFSMLREFHLADFVTLSNGGCGVVSIFFCLAYANAGVRDYIYIAACLVVLALVLDIMDGAIARLRHQSSVLGRELDSLADVISFGVAPAVIAYAAGMNSLLDSASLVFFTLCGLSRLARYNISAEALSEAGKVRYYEGTPIPTSVIPLGMLLLAFQHDRYWPIEIAGQILHLAVLPFVLSGCLMISKTLRIPKP